MSKFPECVNALYLGSEMFKQNSVMQRGNFLRKFMRAWAGLNPNKDYESSIPYFTDQYEPDSYLSNFFYSDKKKLFPKYVLVKMLDTHAENFKAWLSGMTEAERDRIMQNVREHGFEVESTDDLFESLLCELNAELSERASTTADRKSAKISDTMNAEENEVTEANEENEAIEAIEVAEAIEADEQQVSVPSRLYFRLQRGWKTLMEFSADEVDAALAAFVNADQAGKGAILYIGVEESDQEIILARYPDGAIHLALPPAVPASMLCEPEAYRIVATICNSMQPVVQRGDNNANRFFMKKVAKLQVALANGAQPDDKPLPYDDEKSEISFVVKCKPWGRGEEFADFAAAREAWQKASPLAMLQIRFANPALGQEWRATIASRGHMHFDDIYRIPLMMASDKVKAFLSEYSAGKMTFWGLT